MILLRRVPLSRSISTPNLLAVINAISDPEKKADKATVSKIIIIRKPISSQRYTSEAELTVLESSGREGNQQAEAPLNLVFGFGLDSTGVINILNIHIA